MTPLKTTVDPAVRAFFEGFERSSETGDSAGLAKLYAESFIVAAASGVHVLKASDFAQIVPRRKQMLESVGCDSAKLVSLNETRLDDHYTMVRAEWRWQVTSRGNESQEITLPSTYIVRQSSDGLQIVFYLAHGDITAVLRERGLL